jgi:hypothetical protein
VVPPSKHINGKHYSIINDCEIADFPEELTKSAFRSHQTKHKKSVSKTSKKNIVVNSWSEKTIKEIREHMEHGLIPEGVRNNTLYRLLCSDRANGYNTKKELIEKGYFYLTRFDNAESFTDKELETVVESVLKHPEYNTSFEKVNENYVKWLENHGYHTVENLETKVKEIDNKFFSNLIPTNGTVGVSLKEIITARKEFFRIHGLNRCSSYKPSFLGMKIRSLGFVRRRTSKNNFWNVSLEKMVSFSDQQW